MLGSFMALSMSLSRKRWKKETEKLDPVLGVDPKSGEEVIVKVGRFGPVAQIGTTEGQ